DTFSLYLFKFADGIKNIPMSVDKLYGNIAKVLYGNLIGKHKMHLSRIGILGLIDNVYRYFYAGCYLCIHLFNCSFLTAFRILQDTSFGNEHLNREQIINYLFKHQI